MSEQPSNKLSPSTLIARLLSGIYSSRIKVIQKNSNPIKIDFEGIIYNIYLKNVSHGGGRYPENTTRAQLPSSPAFELIKSSDERFLFLGYANDSDVFVCWDPVKAKNRLNIKSYVSFFSRKSVQDSADVGSIRKASLTNGDVFVAFKRVDFEAFLNIIEEFFPSLSEHQQPLVKAPISDLSINQPKGEDVVGILSKIENDSSIKQLIDSMSPTNKTMNIIAQCMNTYGSNYPNMQFKDWAKLIRKYIENHG